MILPKTLNKTTGVNKMKNWKVVTVYTNRVCKDEVFETGLTYNEARKMAKEYNSADHHGQIFKAVPELTNNHAT